MYLHCDHWEHGARTGKSGGLHSEHQVKVGRRKKISTLDGARRPKAAGYWSLVSCCNSEASDLSTGGGFYAQ